MGREEQLAVSKKYGDIFRNSKGGCEMLMGNIVAGGHVGSEGRRLCFMLGTLLDDYICSARLHDKVTMGPVMVQTDECNIIRCDLMVSDSTINGSRYRQAEDEYGSGRIKTPGFAESFGTAISADVADTPALAVNIMSEKTALYECMDRAQAYSEAGTGEYWLVDMDRQFVYVFSFSRGISYSRYSFEQNIESTRYPGFSCSISQMMWEDRECLRDLSVFYKFKKEISPGPLDMLVAQPNRDYKTDGRELYNAALFREWIRTRRHRPEYSDMTELLLGEICPEEVPGFRHQLIQGNIYFAVKSYLREHTGQWQLCFSPMEVEMTGKGLLDCVLRPDIFIVPEEEEITGNIYRGVPPWIIEIADPASAARDYIDKEQIYRFHGVQEYWIVNDWKKQVMVIKFDDSEKPGIFTYDESISPGAMPGLNLKMNDVLE